MNQNLKTLEDIIQKEFGVVGTEERKNFDEGFENFKLGKAIKEARIAKGLTQEKLAEKCGMDRHYISKIENNIKEARISTLEKIVELGFGGRLEVSIKI